jgi:hypothetical protein
MSKKNLKVDLDLPIKNLDGSVFPITKKVGEKLILSTNVLDALATTINRAATEEEKMEMLKFLQDYREDMIEKRDCMLVDAVRLALQAKTKPSVKELWIMYGIFPKLHKGGKQAFERDERLLILRAAESAEDAQVNPIAKAHIVGEFDPGGLLGIDKE